ncbi:unnamed protein product [Porites lobata]|uniref:Uncharacterized protein n=1 Tax=Porites lobata TaxID=104759 RepID=A0ABN8MXQ7_9CNID|nr:unnamed protein product [Porites lobata]
MALKESELRVLGILGLVIVILWAFFGLVWSFLLVFTFLIYAYNFGRQQRYSSHEIGQDEPDVPFQEKMHDYYSEFQDMQFTGSPKGQFTLRSPMPLLSEVTKRLSFNTSSIPQYSPHQARKPWHNNRELHNPYQLSRASPVAYWRKSNHFSLLNPALQRPSTVKIASPDVTINRTFTLSNSPLKRTTPDPTNPCSRATVLSALKESRKRSYVVDEEDDLELSLRPTKRRGTNPVSSKTLDSPDGGPFLRSNRTLSGGLKRTANQDSKETRKEENINKRSKIIDHTTVQPAEKAQDHRNSVLQKRKNVETELAHAASKEDTEGSRSKKIKNKNYTSTGNDECRRHATVEEEDADMGDSIAVSDTSSHEEDTRLSDKEHKENSSKRSSTSQKEKDDVKKRKETNRVTTVHQDRDDAAQQSEHKTVDASKKKQKRFMVPRFASKEDSRRRAVPVYCASNEESEMPQRRKVSRKINQEQIIIDRKLAWERVQKFLDDDEEEEEEDEKEEKSKSGATAVPLTTAPTCISSSLLKIPSGNPVSSTGSLTTVTTQSLVTPALSTGFPKPTTGKPLATAISLASQTKQGNGALAQPQSSAGSLLQSQQSLLANLLTTGAVSSTAATKQDNLVTATCASASNLSLGTLQGNTPFTSSATSLSVPGLKTNSFSSSSLGNSSFLKSKATDNLTSLADSSNQSTSTTTFQLSASIVQSSVRSSLLSSQPSSQKVDFSFPVVSSSGALTSAVTTTQGGFKLSVPDVTHNTFGLETTGSKSSYGAAVINSKNTVTLTTSTSQNPLTFGVAGNNLTSTTQSPFGSIAKSTAVTFTANSSGIFGQKTAFTAQNSSGLTTQNKGAFGSTSLQSLSASTGQAQSASSVNFGASPFTQSSLGTQPSQIASQNAFGSIPTQNAFGTQQSQPASQSTFGSSATQKAFGAQQSQAASQSAFGPKSAFTSDAVKTQNSFGLQAGQTSSQSVFGSQSATQSSFRNQAAQSAFGSPQQPPTQNVLGTQATQNAFGAQLNQPAKQSAFGAPTDQASKSAFSFAPNAVQPNINSPFSSFSSKPSTQNAFGATATQNATGTSEGFQFGATASKATPGGFTFNAAGNNTGSFQFGTRGSSSFSGFGQASVQAPVAMPAPSMPSGGFNFNPGSTGTMGTAFASSTPAPSFGAPSTPQGASSTLTAKTRARLTARRRGKK